MTKRQMTNEILRRGYWQLSQSQQDHLARTYMRMTKAELQALLDNAPSAWRR